MNKKALIILGLALIALLCSCNKKEDLRPTRSDYIKVYETSESKLVDNIQVPFDGVKDGKIHVLSNVDLQWKYLVNQDEADNDWFSIKSVEEAAPGHIVVTYDAGSILEYNSLERREGRLSFSCPSESLAKFLSVRQGYSTKFFEEFSGETGGKVVLTGKETFTVDSKSKLNLDYFDYISFNAWAETTNEFLSKNITLDVTLKGGQFFATGLSTYRVNVPLGTQAEKSNLHYLLIMGNGERMSPETTFTFSTANDAQVYVNIDNFAAYTVSQAEVGLLYDVDDFDFDDAGEADWE